VTIYLVRHAHAGSRSDWHGDDRERPLSSKGIRQANELVERFGDRPITRVLSSPFTRCRQTVQPLADTRGVPVEDSDAMAEAASVRVALGLIRSLAGTEAALCSHGDVIPEVISALARDGVRIDGRRTAAKGGTYVIDIEPDGTVTAATYLDPP
jgi:8-oxo-dGTP diphosphatase